MKSREKVLNLLVKLQAMADESQSNSPEEAAVAVAHMQKLMFAHKISMAEIADVADQEEDPLEKVNVLETEQKKFMRVWKRTLLGALSRVNFCRVVYQTAQKEKRRHVRMGPFIVETSRPACAGFVNVYGRQSDVQKVLYLYQYLTREIDRLTKEALLTAPTEHRNRWTNAFRRGCVDTISYRLKKQFAEQSQNLSGSTTAMVRREEKAVDDFVRQECPHTKRGYSPRVADVSGFVSGQQAGRRVSLSSGNKGLSSPAPCLSK